MSIPTFPSFTWPPPPPPSNSGHNFTSKFIASAAFVSLGGLVSRRFTGRIRLRLNLLLPSPSPYPVPWCRYLLDRIEELWLDEQAGFKKYSSLDMLEDLLSGLYLFDGKDRDDKVYVENGWTLHYRRPNCSGSGTRLWTNVLLGIHVLAYVAQIATEGKLLMWGAKVNSLIDGGQLWRLVTSPLLHANLTHLMVNCFSLNSIGPTVEQLTGSRRLLAVYFTSALASMLMSYRFCQAPSVGASGAIFGLVSSLSIFIWRHRRIIGGGRKELEHIASVIALNMGIGLISRDIDNWGHLGGLLGGIATAWFVGPSWQYQFQADDGRLVFKDRAPIVHLRNRTRFHK